MDAEVFATPSTACEVWMRTRADPAARSASVPFEFKHLEIDDTIAAAPGADQSSCYEPVRTVK